MTRICKATELRFELPGPVSWEQDLVHLPGPLTRYFQETHLPTFKKGINDFARFYGLFIGGLQIGCVNGFGCNQVQPDHVAEHAYRIWRRLRLFGRGFRRRCREAGFKRCEVIHLAWASNAAIVHE